MAHHGPHIEDTLRPETATELALLARIRDLKIALWEGGSPMTRCTLNDAERLISVSVPPPRILQLAASVEAKLETPYGVRVMGRGHGPNAIQHSYYIGEEELAQLLVNRQADMMIELHKRTVHELGKFVRKTFERASGGAQ